MKKFLSLLSAILIVSVNCSVFPALALEETVAETTGSNTEFAIETAEMIKKSDSSMLRIIGRFKKIPASPVFHGASDSVISEDGRFVLQFDSENELLGCLEDLVNDSNVVYAEKDRPIYTAAADEVTEHISWGVGAIGADEYAKNIVLASENTAVTVAIVDSGCANIDFLKDKFVQGYDFFENDKDATNDTSIDSHGTFLASIVADCTQGIPVNIMPVRILSSETGSLINAINGITYAVDNGADVINVSLGGVLSNCKSLDDALKYAEDNDVSVVVCAGNAKSDIKNYCPAHIETAITVSSVNENNEFSEAFSNFGDKIDLAAPGEYIVGYNAYGQKTVMSGTSMSAAFVSAAAAMFRLSNPECTAAQTQEFLKKSTEDFGETGWDKYYGNGILRLNTTIKIKNNNGSNTIDYGETLRLTAIVTGKTGDSKICWYVDGVKTGEGETFDVTFEDGTKTVEAKLVDKDGAVIKNNGGKEIADSETVTVNSGFFRKLISFFKNLFGINRTVVQVFFR